LISVNEKDCKKYIHALVLGKHFNPERSALIQADFIFKIWQYLAVIMAQPLPHDLVVKSSTIEAPDGCALKRSLSS
jgi:hypothetical protein